MKCKSILVVDDNDDIRETLLEALTSEGYRAVGAGNGQEALDQLKNLPVPTLILLDLMMPIMSGWEFLDAQKKDTRFASHRIITISSVNPTQSLEVSEPLDIAGSLQKPLSFGTLWQKIQEFCEKPTDGNVHAGESTLNV